MANDPGDVLRVTRSKSEAQAAYDRLSWFYDYLSDPFEGPHREQGLQMLNPRAGERVLEIGPGPGKVLVAMAVRVGSGGSVYGLDLSMNMLGRTDQRVKEQRLSNRVALQQGDGASLPYQARTFDAIFTSFTLELFDTPEIPRVLAECRRVLRFEGRIVVVSMVKRTKTNLMTRLYEWSHARFPRYADCRPIWLEQDLRGVGFEVIQRRDFSMVGLPGAVILAEYG